MLKIRGKIEDGRTSVTKILDPRFSMSHKKLDIEYFDTEILAIRSCVPT